jgi:hypothetical protein
MGKFLKILRYITNLIATMGQCFSEEQQDGTSSNLTEPLLGGPTQRSDVNPVQGVSISAPNSPEVKDIRCILQQKMNFWRNQTRIYSQDVDDELNHVFLHGSGPVPPILKDHEQRTVMTVKLIHYLSSKINVIRTSTGFVIVIEGISYKLENFDRLLKREISDGDFIEDLEKNSPSMFIRIWKILTSGGPFVALYY